MADWTRQRATAKRLIEGKGGLFTITYAMVDRDAVDAGKPWLGTEPGTGQAVDVLAVRIDYDASRIDGTNIRAGDTELMIAAASITTAPSVGDSVTEADGTVWKVTRVEPLKPGGEPILYTLNLRR
jgi:hypothetical protein